MVDPEVADGNFGIDWEHLLDNLPDELNFNFSDCPGVDELSNTPDSGCCLSIDDIEQYLLNDVSDFTEEKDRIDVEDAFFSNVLLDSVPESRSDQSKESSSSPESIDAGTEEEDKEEDKSLEDGADVQQAEEEKSDVAEDSDPAAKKRKRQMRNRDAAMRSRERKKMYVRDLEMKNKFYEAECKRLGIMLQCYLAENQALKLSLHSTKAFDASMAKQESAVLLLESLLLGSLLGFLGLICLFLLPSHLLSAVLLRNADSAEWQSRAPRRGPSEISNVSFHHSSMMMMGKRCKASRTRMKVRLG